MLTIQRYQLTLSSSLRFARLSIVQIKASSMQVKSRVGKLVIINN